MSRAEAAICPVCSSARSALRYRLTRFEVRGCRDCSLVYLFPLPSPEAIRTMFARLYTTGEGSVPELRSYYGFCYEDEPANPLVQSYERWLAPGGVVGLSTPNQRSSLDLVAGGLYRLSGGRLTAALEKFYIEQHFLYYTPETLADSLARAGLEIVALRRELTDLRRLTLALPTRLALYALFAAARLLGRENRIFAVARAADGARRESDRREAMLDRHP